MLLSRISKAFSVFAVYFFYSVLAFSVDASVQLKLQNGINHCQSKDPLKMGTFHFTPTEEMSHKREYLKLAQSVLDGLKQKGLKKIGTILISTLEREFQLVQISFNLSAGQNYVGSHFRTGSIYIPAEKKVIFNICDIVIQLQKAIQNNSRNSLNMLFFHEYLGALGYHDNNYEITSYAQFLLSAAPSPQQNPNDSIIKNPFGQAMESALIRHLKQNPVGSPIRGLELRGGGTGGVVGGGDSEVATVKAYLLLYAQAMENVYIFNGKDLMQDPQFLISLLAAPIEPNTLLRDDRGQKVPSLSYYADRPRNRIIITLSPCDWDGSGKSKRSLPEISAKCSASNSLIYNTDANEKYVMINHLISPSRQAILSDLLTKIIVLYQNQVKQNGQRP